MKTSESTKEVMTAIFKVQHTVAPLKREASGSTGNRAYKYTPYDRVWSAAEKALEDNHLVVISSPTSHNENGVSGNYFQTTIFHTESGEWIRESTLMLLAKDDPQGVGSAITYYRRYMTVSMLGLVVQGDDNDASDHKLATAQQKVKIFGAAKRAFPEHTTQAALVNAIKDVVGKHPSYIREDEADDALATVEAFVDKKTGVNQDV